MTHSQLVAEIVKLLNQLELWWLYIRDGRALDGCPGWPDFTIIGRRGGLLAEVKSDGGARTRAQAQLADRLDRIGWPYRLWYPDDLRSGRIRRELEAIA